MEPSIVGIRSRERIRRAERLRNGPDVFGIWMVSVASLETTLICVSCYLTIKPIGLVSFGLALPGFKGVVRILGAQDMAGAADLIACNNWGSILVGALGRFNHSAVCGLAECGTVERGCYSAGDRVGGRCIGRIGVAENDFIDATILRIVRDGCGEQTPSIADEFARTVYIEDSCTCRIGNAM